MCHSFPGAAKAIQEKDAKGHQASGTSGRAFPNGSCREFPGPAGEGPQGTKASAAPGLNLAQWKHFTSKTKKVEPPTGDRAEFQNRHHPVPASVVRFG